MGPVSVTLLGSSGAVVVVVVATVVVVVRARVVAVRSVEPVTDPPPAAMVVLPGVAEVPDDPPTEHPTTKTAASTTALTAARSRVGRVRIGATDGVDMRLQQNVPTRHQKTGLPSLTWKGAEVTVRHFDTPGQGSGPGTVAGGARRPC
jgi:hypothetical protein